MTKRFEQAILIVTFLAFCWLAMQAVHELGHVVGAWVGPIKGSAVLLSWLVALQCRGTAGLQAVRNREIPSNEAGASAVSVEVCRHPADK